VRPAEEDFPALSFSARHTNPARQKKTAKGKGVRGVMARRSVFFHAPHGFAIMDASF
jgi:hypothetical protein